MNANHIAHALARLAELHGSRAVIETLRDACREAATHATDGATGSSEAWQKAGNALSLAAGAVATAESACTDINLESALLVISEARP